MTKNYLCIHGHFYQPPRENPWLDTIEKERSAAPFDNWNQRINQECYHTNAFARILNDERRIRRVLNNYEFISFNFGPTLLSWMEKMDMETYEAILNADRRSLKRWGHGNALAQVYNHIIMPLANERDKHTQVIWGIRDFEFRFGRKPEGMWLAETAVDIPTLEVLAEHGIEFTILAPGQAKAFRKIEEKAWHEVNGDINTRRPYICQLPSGKSISLFFYDGGMSQAVAFEGLLNYGRFFAERLTSSFNDEVLELVNIATDGESYGHHHRHGEMALAHAIHHIQKHQLAKLTNYATFLEEFPPEYEVKIQENSSWSCYHGVERWRSNCGCHMGGNPDWNQEWRSHLRELLNWLRDELAEIYERETAPYTENPWDLRNNYIHWILKNRNISPVVLSTPNEENPEVHDLSDPYHLNPKVLQLLEMQHNALLMFTSCAWFFDEVSGIEPTQVLKYAKRAMEIAKDLTGIDLHDEFLARLEATPSNVYENGAHKYKEEIIPARLKAIGKVFYQGFKLINHTTDIETIRSLTQMLNDLNEANIQIEKLYKSQNHYHKLENKLLSGELAFTSPEWKSAYHDLGLALGFD
jgi:alpha-amylase/alpha-mannosidase (GH57 family)